MAEHTSPDPEHPLNEPPAEDRPSSAAPTEQQLEQETPTVAKLDQSPQPAHHDPYAALRYPAYVYYGASYSLAVIGGQIQTVALAWQLAKTSRPELALGFRGGIQVIPLFLL